MNSMDAFQRFAASCPFSYHGYLDIQGETLVYQQEQVKPASTSLEKITNLALFAFTQNPTLENREALRIFTSHLESKNTCLSDIFNCNLELNQIVAKIKAVLETQELQAGNEETVFRLKFLSELPRTLGVKHAPKTQTVTINWLNGESTAAEVKEWETIKWLSRQVYHSKAVATAENKWQVYCEIMTGAYQGDHLLFSDDQNHQLTKELIAMGGIVRVSSHNERGRVIKGWNESGSANFKGFRYQDIKSLSDTEHHWSLEGDHISEILFYAADMRKTKKGKLVCAKTARQVDHLIKAGKLKAKDIDQKTTHYYTAFQFEFAPDCEGKQLLNWKYWHHKVYSSYVYRAMKRMGYENANVGPYGFGRTDQNPRVLEAYEAEIPKK